VQGAATCQTQAHAACGDQQRRQRDLPVGVGCYTVEEDDYYGVLVKSRVGADSNRVKF
jgi:hypothetical protein